MEVFNTSNATQGAARRSPQPESRRAWRNLLFAACCGASLTATGCQSPGLLSKSKSAEDSPRDAMAKLLAESRAASGGSTATAASNSSVLPMHGGAGAGPATVAQHLQLGDQALADHAQNPARLVEAQAHFEEVLRASPSHPTAHHRLGVVADLNHDYPRAERHYAQALQQSPHDSQLLHDIGYSYLLQDKPEQAIPYLQQALTLSPTFDMAARKLADAQVRTRQIDLATQTLRQVLPEPQVQEELARLKSAHDPAAKPSLLGRVRENMRDLRPESTPPDARQQLLAELELARGEVERARADRAAQSQPPSGHPANSPWGMSPQQQKLHYNSQLSQAIADIDRRSAPPVGQPVYLDATSGGTPQYGQPQYGQPQSQQYVQTQQYGQPPHPQAGHGWGTPQMATAMPQGGQVPTGHGLPMVQPQVTANSAASVHTPSGFPGDADPRDVYSAGPGLAASPATSDPENFSYAEVIRGSRRGTAAPWEAQTFSQQNLAGRPGVSPANGIAQGTQPPAIQPAGGQMPASQAAVTPASREVNSALYTEPSPYWATPSLGGNDRTTGSQVPPANGASVQSSQMMQGHPHGGTATWGANASADDYRTAAALGMGAGPGQMFPVLRQTEVVSPGTGSTWNGTQFPQPARQLPIDRPLADLSRAHELPSQQANGGAPLATGPSSLGQQMPSVGQYWTQPDQFASGQSYQQPAGGQPVNHPSTEWNTSTTFQPQLAQPAAANPMHEYDQLRAQRDAQLNAVIQQVQGRSPTESIATPSYGLPMDRPAAAASQMNNWYPNGAGAATTPDGRSIVVPEQYPSVPGYTQPAPAVPQQPQVAPQANIMGTLPPAQYGQHVVVPPAYGSRGQVAPAGGPTGAGYAGPAIHPGR